MRINTLALVFLVLLFILFLDIFTSNSISKLLHTLIYKSAFPLYNVKNALEWLFEKNYSTVKVNLFGNTPTTALEVLSVDSKGIYVRNLKKKGIAISATDGKLIGFVQKTGSVGYISKWWEDNFPVTIESTDNLNYTHKVRSVGYYSNYRIEMPDPADIVNGKVYMSEYMPYGRLLKNFGIFIGEYQNGVFKLLIPKIPKYVVILEEYEPNGGN